jgi:uncharacterized protein YjbI with pentapeptide repeats
MIGMIGTARLAAAAAFATICASATLAADLTAREVVERLFAAEASQPIDFSNHDLSRLDLSGVNFKKANLAGSNLYGADLSGSNLASANLAAARLDRATLIGADFSKADLSGATLLRPNNFTDLSAGNQSETISFRGANLTKAHLSGRFDFVDFSRADLSYAVFGPRDPREEELISPMTSLVGADFSKATLKRVNLARSRLDLAKFQGADLTGASFSGAGLGGADFSNATLDGADFTGASLDGAKFDGAIGVERATGLSR